MAPNPQLQGIIYLVCETVCKFMSPTKFDRELLKMADGGTCGLEWDGGIPTEDNPNTKPLLIICPGLGGGSQNLYSLALLWKAREAGFKVVTILFRGAENLPITTPKLSHSGCWEDAQTCIEYVVKKYVRDPKTQKARTRVYCYGVSLGANILALYLGHAGDKAKQYLDAALLYGCPWSTKYGYRFFFDNFYGLWQKIVGLALNNEIKTR